MRRELLVGCGNARTKAIALPSNQHWDDLVTLDHKDDCGADVVHDLDILPYPFETSEFDEIHAYDVLEHCGKQGDWKFFFGQFTEFHRILKPGGFFFGVCPTHTSEWAWGDPSHTRVFPRFSLGFLSQKMYEKDVGVSSRSDFRSVYKADFDIVHVGDYDEHRHSFVLKALKE